MLDYAFDGHALLLHREMLLGPVLLLSRGPEGGSHWSPSCGLCHFFLLCTHFFELLVCRRLCICGICIVVFRPDANLFRAVLALRCQSWWQRRSMCCIPHVGILYTSFFGCYVEGMHHICDICIVHLLGNLYTIFVLFGE